MAVITKSWRVDLTFGAIGLIAAGYFSYGTWVFTTAVYSFLSVYLFYQYKFLYWRRFGIPVSTPHFPMGDVWSIFSKAPGEVLKDMYDRGKGHRFVGVWFLFKPAILLRDPELIKEILVREFITFQERGIYMNKKSDPLSGHIFSLGGQKWRNLRAKLTPTFTSGKMKAMFPHFVEMVSKFEDVLMPSAVERKVVNVKELAACFATDLTTLTAFGITTHALTDPKEPFRIKGRKVFRPSFFTIVRSLMPFLVPDLASLIGIISTPRDVTSFFMKAVKDIVEYRERNNINREDFMGILVNLKKQGKINAIDGIELRDENKNEDHIFTVKDIAAECFLFFVGGFETAATAISWAIYELAINQDLQKKTRSEIHRVLKKYDGKITYEGVQELTYLDRIISESLRKYPPVPLLLRKSNAPYKVPGTDFVIPTGTQVHISVHGLQRDPQFFPEPDVFDPDRFTEEAKRQRHHYAYLPFGEGPRNCFGMRYSMMQKKTGLIAMLDKFEYSIVKESPYPLKFDPDSFVFAPKNGLFLRISRVE